MRLLAPALLLALAGPAWAKKPEPQPEPEPPAVEAAAPEGFRVMEVVGVMPTPAGEAVFLADAASEALVPIWIGGTEALAIHLRLERRRYERPLTHDLWDQAVRELGGQLVEVRIDALRSGVFVATLTVRQGEKTIKIDSRASDAIALALGNGVPIYVADAVVEATSLTQEDLERLAEDPVPVKPEGPL